VAVLSIWLLKRPLGTAPGPSVKSITVLPFRPLAEGAQDEYLGLGIADTLITKLSNIRQIIVRPTTAVQKYAGPAENPLAAGREQRTDAVLEGNIQRAGERIRVSARLLRVRDGTALWSEQFDVESSDVFTAEDSICRRVTAALAFRLSPEEEKQLVKRYTASTEAYRAYVRADTIHPLSASRDWTRPSSTSSVRLNSTQRTLWRGPAWQMPTRASV
jgi:TolB-like protein